MEKNHQEATQPTRVRLDDQGIPILDEVIGGLASPGSASEHPKLDVEIQRLARSIAADVAIEFARELEGRLLQELAPLLEERMKQLQQPKPDAPT